MWVRLYQCSIINIHQWEWMPKWVDYYHINNTISLSTGQHYAVLTLAAIIRFYRRVSLTSFESVLTFTLMIWPWRRSISDFNLAISTSCPHALYKYEVFIYYNAGWCLRIIVLLTHKQTGKLCACLAILNYGCSPVWLFKNKSITMIFWWTLHRKKSGT